MRIGHVSAALALMALGAVTEAEPYVVRARNDAPKPRRRREPSRPSEPTSGAPREAKFIGDGFDRDRIEAAERKRARKAAKLADKQPKENER